MVYTFNGAKNNWILKSYTSDWRKRFMNRHCQRTFGTKMRITVHWQTDAKFCKDEWIGSNHTYIYIFTAFACAHVYVYRWRMVRWKLQKCGLRMDDNDAHASKCSEYYIMFAYVAYMMTLNREMSSHKQRDAVWCGLWLIHGSLICHWTIAMRFTLHSIRMTMDTLLFMSLSKC